MSNAAEVTQCTPKVTPDPEPRQTRTYDTNPESGRTIASELQDAVERLYDHELGRLDARGTVLRYWRLLDHPDQLPQKLQQRIALLLAL